MESFLASVTAALPEGFLGGTEHVPKGSGLQPERQFSAGKTPEDGAGPDEGAASAGKPFPAEDGLNGCFRRLECPGNICIELYSFPDGRSLDLQLKLGEKLSSSPACEVAGAAMLMLLEEGLTDKDRAACVTQERGAAYYMLCDDEELGFGDDGSPDGDLRIRRKCVSWRLVCFTVSGPAQAPRTAFVEFTGIRPGGEQTGKGFMFSGGELVELYSYDDKSLNPVNPLHAKKAQAFADLAWAL